MTFFKDCGCGCKGQKQEKKFLISLMSAIIFIIIASPQTYMITRRIFGGWVASPNGCSSTMGLLLHAVVFLLITWGLMNVRAEYMESEMADMPVMPAMDPTKKDMPAEMPDVPAKDVVTVPVVEPTKPMEPIITGPPPADMVPMGTAISSTSIQLSGLNMESDTTEAGSYSTCTLTSGKKIIVME